MKARSDNLLYHVPGVVTSFYVSYNANGSNIINVKKTLNRLTANLHTSDKEENPNKNDSSVSLVKKPTPRYDNIIEMLEKKYRDPLLNNDNSNRLDDSLVSTGTDSEIPGSHCEVATKKLKGNKFDNYDYEDNFIDDTECLVQVSAQLKSKKLKTKHDGFFVNAGRLEVETAKIASVSVKKSPVKDGHKLRDIDDKDKLPRENSIGNKSRLSTSSSTSISSDGKGKSKQTSKANRNTPTSLTVSPSAVTSTVTATSPKQSSVPSSTHSSSVSPRQEVSSSSSFQSPPPPGSSSSSSQILVDGDSEMKPTAVVVKDWDPTPAETQALEQFRRTINDAGLKASKNYFPYELEPALIVLDTSAPIKHIQYLQAVCDAVGGLYTIGRLRLLLSRLQIERKAKIAKSILDKNLSELKSLLKLRIGPAPPRPPTVTVTTTSPSVNDNDNNEDSLKSSSVNIQSPTASTHKSDATGVSTSSSSSKMAAAAVDLAADEDDDNAAQRQSQQTDQQHLPKENAITSESSSSSVSAQTPVVTPEYKFLCKWDTACRMYV